MKEQYIQLQKVCVCIYMYMYVYKHTPARVHILLPESLRDYSKSIETVLYSMQRVSNMWYWKKFKQTVLSIRYVPLVKTSWTNNRTHKVLCLFYFSIYLVLSDGTSTNDKQVTIQMWCVSVLDKWLAHFLCSRYKNCSTWP